MDKYAVVEDETTKVAEEGHKCPKCGSHVATHGKTDLCEKCGSEPFEPEEEK